MKRIFLFSLLMISLLSLEVKAKDIDVVVVDNYIINPVIEKFITESIKKAEDKDSICVIIQLDTPGGLLESTRKIVKKILNSKVPVIVYIAPQGSRAGSAGVFITYASHLACMAPSTNIGAAHPVGLGMGFKKEKEKNKESASEEDILGEKIINDTVAWITAIARYRKRNIQWAKKAVTESVSITEKEALKQNVIELIAEDTRDLIQKINGYNLKLKSRKVTLSTKGADLNYLYLSNRDKILYSIAHPNVAYILMLLGIIGLIFEFSHPGIGFPGIAGLMCLLLAFYSFQLLPINYVGVLLIFLGFILFIAEILTPTFGLLSLGGIISLVLGSLMLIKSPYPFLRLSLGLVLPLIMGTSFIVLFLIGNAIKTHRRKVTTGKEGLIGKLATTITDLKPKGKVLCHGEIWNAESVNKKLIPQDRQVRIINIEGLKLIVKEE